MDEQPIDLSRRRRRRSTDEKPRNDHTSTMSPEELVRHNRRRALATPLAEVFKDKVNVVNMFEGAGLITVQQLLAVSLERLFAIPNFGEKTFKTVAAAIRKLELSTSWTRASRETIRQAIRDTKKTEHDVAKNND